jgi:trimeric autotransporter adhesin
LSRGFESWLFGGCFLLHEVQWVNSKSKNKSVKGSMKAFLSNFSAAAVVASALFINQHCALAADVTGDRAKIGSNQNLTGTWATITGGSNNSATVEYSVIAGGKHNVVDGHTSVVSGGQENKILTTNGLPTGQNITSYGVIAGGVQNTLFGEASVISGGEGNFIDAWVNFSVIGGGLDNTIAYGSGYSTISGGTDNTIEGGAWWAAINGGRGNEIEGPADGTNGPTANHFGWIGGGENNYIHEFGTYGSIGGGAINSIDGTGAVIGGGSANTNNAWFSTIPGGILNLIETNAYYSVIGGGYLNLIARDSDQSTICGGSGNKITNGAGGSIIVGGSQNSVGGELALAAGYSANAAHAGSFVWSDASSSTIFSSTNNNEFCARTTGGVRFQTGAGTGVKLSAGSGSWASLSDRNAKTNFAKISPRQILAGVASLPLGTWNYKAQDESIRHIGPTAQDFHAAFGVGEDERTITSIDADGVTLAAIQALNELVQEKDIALQAQGKLVRDLADRLQALEKQVSGQGH